MTKSARLATPAILVGVTLVNQLPMMPSPYLLAFRHPYGRKIENEDLLRCWVLVLNTRGDPPSTIFLQSS